MGDIVWSAVAVAVSAWLVLATLARRGVGPDAVGRWLVSAWAPRVLALAAWAEIGWHLFCQRP